jgi:hypothetical protein
MSWSQLSKVWILYCTYSATTESWRHDTPCHCDQQGSDCSDQFPVRASVVFQAFSNPCKAATAQNTIIFVVHYQHFSRLFSPLLSSYTLNSQLHWQRQLILSLVKLSSALIKYAHNPQMPLGLVGSWWKKRKFCKKDSFVLSLNPNFYFYFGSWQNSEHVYSSHLNSPLQYRRRHCSSCCCFFPLVLQCFH